MDNLFERIRTFGIFAGAQGGQYVAALSGVEIALWDLAGKALGLPVYQLLGGKMRDKVRVYCDSQTEDPDDPQAKEKLAGIRDMGFTAVKIDVDDRNDPNRWDAVNWTASNAEVDTMIRKIAFVRESFPKRVDLAVDMHGRYDVTTGKRVAKEAEPFKLLWLEEPVPPENVDAMREVRESTSTPICCGENLFLRHGFREVLEKRAADIIMPDIQKCGGLLEARKIADMAHTYYVPFAPHCVVSPIGTMASAHVCAAVPNFLVLEWHWIQRLELWKSFVKEGEIIEKGWISRARSSGPGGRDERGGGAPGADEGDALVRAYGLRRRGDHAKRNRGRSRVRALLGRVRCGRGTRDAGRHARPEAARQPRHLPPRSGAAQGEERPPDRPADGEAQELPH